MCVVQVVHCPSRGVVSLDNNVNDPSWVGVGDSHSKCVSFSKPQFPQPQGASPVSGYDG